MLYFQCIWFFHLSQLLRFLTKCKYLNTRPHRISVFLPLFSLISYFSFSYFLFTSFSLRLSFNRRHMLLFTLFSWLSLLYVRTLYHPFKTILNRVVYSVPFCRTPVFITNPSVIASSVITAVCGPSMDICISLSNLAEFVCRAYFYQNSNFTKTVIFEMIENSFLTSHCFNLNFRQLQRKLRIR